MRLTEDQTAEIAAQRGQRRPTRRPTVPALEELLYQAIPVLDHGFIRVIDYMGDDAAIVQAARVSYGRGTRRVSEDRAHPLPDAAPALDAVRDVRDQVPCEAADLRRPAVDPPPDRERERVLRAVLDPGPGVLPPGAGAPRGAVDGQPPGPGGGAGGEEAAQVLDLLRGDADALYDHYRRC